MTYSVFVTKGAMKAPTMYFNASSTKDAEKLARDKSGLGKFKQWTFTGKAVEKSKNSVEYTQAQIARFEKSKMKQKATTKTATKK